MNPMRTLIVDDEAPARERLKRLLAGLEGVEVIGEAEDGVQAVEMIEEQRPDLVLLDIQMPGLDGFGVIEALEDPPADHLCHRLRRVRHPRLRGPRPGLPAQALQPGAPGEGHPTAPRRRWPRSRISAPSSARCWRAWPPRDAT